jgi:hypothetical protein
MSVIPAKTSGLKLISWVFDASIAKDCGYFLVKVLVGSSAILKRARPCTGRSIMYR